MNDVTGGDLYSLWKIANVALPRVAAVYGSTTGSLNGNQSGMAGSFESGEGPHGSAAYSPIYGSFSQVYNEFQHILAITGRNISDSADAMNKALEGFKGQDSDAAGDLETILKGEKFEGTMLHDPNDPQQNPPTEKPKDSQGPEGYESPGDKPAGDVEEEKQDIEDAQKDIPE